MSDKTIDREAAARADQVVDRALQMLVDHDMNGFADLWDPEGSIEFPFHAAGYPPEVVGREAIREYMAHYTDIVDVREVVRQRRLFTDDPGTVVLEFELGGIGVASRRPYTMAYVAVITVGEGGIVSYRDYWSPAAAEKALEVGITDVGDQLAGDQS